MQHCFSRVQEPNYGPEKDRDVFGGSRGFVTDVGVTLKISDTVPVCSSLAQIKHFTDLDL